MHLNRMWPILLVFLRCTTGGSEYGKEIRPACAEPTCRFRLDFNQDGLADSLVLLRASESSKIDGKAKLVEPGGGSTEFQPGNQILLGIRLSGAGSSGYNTYVICDKEFFSTPIWQSTSFAVEVIRQEDIAPTGYGELSDLATGDVFALGTEAGIDVYLYWASGNFGLFGPDEEP